MTSRSHRCVAVLTVLALLLTVVSAVTAFAAADIEGHWAQDAIEQLVEKGAVSGLPDGTFRPDLTVTRSEFVTMVNKSLGITSVIGSSRFQDVKPGDWFAGQVEAAAAYGYVAGNPDGTFSPYRPITREQAAAMLVRAFGLNKLTTEAEQNAVLSSFVDAGQVSAWAKADVATAVSIGLMSGYTSSTLAPQPVGLTTAGWQRSEGARTTEQREAVLKQLGSHGLITRAEIAAVLVRALAPEPGIAVTVFDEAGTYGPKEGVETISSDVIVKADGVTLQNLIITGNLIIDASVGDGTVVLENVTVKGDAEVKGGGTNGVIFRGCTLHGTVIVEKVDSKIRIVAEGSTSIPKVVLQSGAILISQDDGSFERVELPKDLAKGTEVVLTGNFAKIEIAAQKANVTVGEGSTIDELVLSKNASETQVELDKKASVNTVIANAKVEITGQGSIAKAKINISGVLIEQKPDKVILAEGVRANVAGKDVPESKKSTGGGGPSKPTEILVSAINIATNPSVTASVDNNAKVEVTLTTATSSADIYYTTDGMTPTTSSSKYSVPFIVDTNNTAGETITIKAIGIKAGYKNSAVAEKEIVFKAIEAEFAGGDGSSGNPYQVTTAEHLNNVRNHLNDHFIQTEDIDLKSYLSEGGAGYNDGAGWIPMGERFYEDIPEKPNFTGNYNGGGFTISNLMINSASSYVGLFGESTGTISDLSLTGVDVKGKNYVGGLIGSNHGGTVINCNVTGDVGFYEEYGSYIGGLIGVIKGGSTSRCYSKGTVSAKNGINVGGLIGKMEEGFSSDVIESYSTSNVTGGTQVGGLVGANIPGESGGNNITNSYATGSVSQDISEGNTNHPQPSIGGLVGYNAGAVTNSYAIGRVTGPGGNIGGLIGEEYNYTATVFNSYWDTVTSGLDTSAGGTGKTTTEMKTQTTLTGWDFDTIWRIKTDPASYPYLQWQGNENIPYPPIQTYYVGGTVYDFIGGSNNLKDITVTLYAATDTSFETPLGTGTTDINGNYGIDNRVTNGSYVVHIEASTGKYAESIANVEVNGDDITSVNITLQKETELTYTITYSVIGSVGGSLSASLENGDLVASGDSVEAGSDITFTASVQEGYKIKQWIYNGFEIKEDTNPMNISSIDMDINMVVEFTIKREPLSVTVTKADKAPTGLTDFPIEKFETNQNAVVVEQTGNTVTVSGPLAALESYAQPGQGDSHKYVALFVDTGEENLEGMFYNGNEFTAVDIPYYNAFGVKPGTFVQWIKAEEVVNTPTSFTLSKEGKADTEITISFYRLKQQ